MNRFLIMTAITLVSCTKAFCQASFSGADAREEEVSSESSNASRVVFTDLSTLEHITMKQQDGQLVFSNLPAVNSLRAYVTNANGDEMMHKSISPKSAVLNISRLKKGSYFVTIISERTDRRKSFRFTL